jgi:SRSO17 transposase
LQQFLTDSPWNHEELWSAVRSLHLSQINPIDLWLVNERLWPKQGKHSVGVAIQDSAGKARMRCQLSLEILVGSSSLATPAAGRLHLPKDWHENDKRLQLRIPADVKPESKAALAVHLLSQTLQDGIHKAPVVAESEFGNDSLFRDALRQLGLEFFLGIDASRHFCEHMNVPRRPRKNVRLLNWPCSIAELVELTPPDAWEYEFTPESHNGRESRFLWQRIMVLGKPRVREMVWLVVERPKASASCRRVYLSHLHREPTEKLCATFMRSPEYLRNHQQCFVNVLDLASYQGRTWCGFHHHLALAAVACSFIFVCQLDKCGLRIQSAAELDDAIADEVIRLRAFL